MHFFVQWNSRPQGFRTAQTSHIVKILTLFLVSVKNVHSRLKKFNWPCIVINSYNKTNQMYSFFKFIFGIKLYMFRTVPLSIIRSFSLHTEQWYMSYRFADSLRADSKPVWHIPANLYDIYHCCVYSEKLLNDGQRNCPKHAEFYSKNKFEKLVHLVGFIIRINFY